MTAIYERFLNGRALRKSEQVTLNNIGYETIELPRGNGWAILYRRGVWGITRQHGSND